MKTLLGKLWKCFLLGLDFSYFSPMRFFVDPPTMDVTFQPPFRSVFWWVVFWGWKFRPDWRIQVRYVCHVLLPTVDITWRSLQIYVLVEFIGFMQKYINTHMEIWKDRFLCLCYPLLQTNSLRFVIIPPKTKMTLEHLHFNGKYIFQMVDLPLSC